MTRKFEGIWIPAKLWLSTELKPVEKILLKEIDSLDNGDDGCVARNDYFADLLGVSPTYISKMISKFIDRGYLRRHIKYFTGSKQVQKRHLWVIKLPQDDRVLKDKTWLAQRVIDIDNSDATLLNIGKHPLYSSKSPYLLWCRNISTITINKLFNSIERMKNSLESKDEEIMVLKNQIEELKNETKKVAPKKVETFAEAVVEIQSEELGLPEEEVKILVAIQEVREYFEQYPAMLDQLKSTYRIKDPNFDMEQEIDKWVRHVSDRPFVMSNIKKHISKGFGSWLSRYNGFNRKTSSYGKSSSTVPKNLITAETAKAVMLDLMQDDE